MDNHSNSQIECPNCGEHINVSDALSQQLSEQFKKEYQDKAKLDNKQLAERLATFESDKQEFIEAKSQQDKFINDQVKSQLKNEQVRLRKEIKHDLDEEQSDQMKLIQEELDEKSKELKEFNKAKTEISKLKREKSELKESIEAESERKLNEQIALEREKIKRSETEKNQLFLSEKQHVIDQLHKQLEDAQRKAAQGSMQVQGEVQETAIEDWLKEQFPLDTIDEIKKGERGADCLQTVNSRAQRECGTIYYESKRTKHFSQGWIEKFKADIREKGAGIGVLVTKAMPDDMERMGLRDGIWICTYQEFKGLCHVLRESIIRISQAIAIQDNKGDKMSMLYDFLTGNEFRMQVEAIVEGFTQMSDDLVKEKRAMASLWKKREKQIEKVILNTTNMYSSVQGIAGSAVKSLALLELADSEGGER